MQCAVGERAAGRCYRRHKGNLGDVPRGFLVGFIHSGLTLLHVLQSRCAGSNLTR